MKIEDRIPAKLHPAIEFAVMHCDKELLNRIELEVVRALCIQPNEDVVPDDGLGSYANVDADLEWEAVAIIEQGRDLAVLWKSASAGDCQECDGDGELEAEGRRRTYCVTCPACDGDGKSETGGTPSTCWTDIDGAPVTAPRVDPDEIAFHIGGPQDSLAMFFERRLKAEKAIA